MDSLDPTQTRVFPVEKNPRVRSARKVFGIEFTLKVCESYPEIRSELARAYQAVHLAFRSPWTFNFHQDNKYCLPMRDGTFELDEFG